MEIDSFKKTVWDFYAHNKRDFPWRNTTNPYFIFLSEVALQQTQTSRVIQKYLELTAAFPTVQNLAAASFPQVLKVWMGLGYNRRAKFLHEAAKMIVQKYGGKFPHDPTLLDELPGVGYNTAAAICVYSFNEPHVFIETNIRRVFIHHFFEDQEKVSDKEILPLVEKTLDRANSREWYWALMDYGSFLPKVIPNPNHKSAHYTKQSKFEGSSRQVRASILRLLVNGTKTKEYLETHVIGNTNHFEKALGELVREGLVLQKGDNFSLQ